MGPIGKNFPLDFTISSLANLLLFYNRIFDFESCRQKQRLKQEEEGEGGRGRSREKCAGGEKGSHRNDKGKEKINT